MDELFKKIVSCMDELAEAKGLERCGLMYALAKLFDTYRQEAEKKISDLETALKEKEE